MARYLYKFRISFRGADFSGIKNPPKPSPEAFKDLRKAASLVAPPSKINEKIFACQVLMADLVGKRLNLSLDPSVFPLNGSNPFLSLKATSSERLDVDRIFFPSGTYPLLDASETMFLGLEGNWDQESLSRWEEENGPLYGGLSLSMDIGEGKRIDPVCFSSISMEYTGYRMHLDGESSTNSSLREMRVSREEFEDTIHEYPELWIEVKRPKENMPIAYFSGSLSTPFDMDKEGHSDTGKIESSLILRKKKGYRSKWPVDATITCHSGDGKAWAQIRANYAPFKRVKKMIRDMYSSKILLKMLQRSAPKLELAKARWWINLIDSRAGKVEVNGWDNTPTDTSHSIALPEDQYQNLVSVKDFDFHLLYGDGQDRPSPFAVFVPGSLEKYPEYQGNVHLFRIDDDRFYLIADHNLAMLGDNAYSINFSYHKILSGGAEKAIETARHWANISIASLLGYREISLYPRRIITSSNGNEKLEGEILGFDLQNPCYENMLDRTLQEIIISIYGIERFRITDTFDLKQNPEAIPRLMKEVNQKFEIELYPEAMEIINTYQDLKDGVDLFLDLKRQDEANR